ncbi:MAG: hypothetical protein Q7S05_03730 [bacterium]|nr:hypothetical protein [bacterium]
MGLEPGFNKRYSPEQVKEHEENRERFDLQISNDTVRGKWDPSWNSEDEQMAKIQTHAIFEKHLREGLKEGGVRMREDDLQKLISVNGPLLRTIGSRIERQAGNLPSFKVTDVFGGQNHPRMTHGDDAQELARRYPMESLQKAAEKALQKTENEIKQREEDVPNAVDEM